MKRPLVKVCGITNYDDAHICLEHGADMLGFIFYEKSPRYVLPETSCKIIADLKADFAFHSVGVFVNPYKEFVDHAIEIAGLDILQFHGDESLSFIKCFDKKKIKAFRIREKSDILQCNEYKDVNYFLFDTFSKESYGGTGKVFNWNLLNDFMYKERLFLSGGINSGNIIRAIEAIAPYAIDISSGLEKEPGKKDNKKVEKIFTILNNSEFS